MKIETIKEIHQQTLVVSNILTIELSQEEDGPVEIRLVPHYEHAVYFVVHDLQGNPQSMPLEAANLAVLNQFVKDPNSLK